MAVPRKTSKREEINGEHMKLTVPGLISCPQCHEPKLPHRVCAWAIIKAEKL